MSNTVKDIVKIILIVLILAAEIFFGIKINDVNVDLEDTKSELRDIQEENAQLREAVTEFMLKEKE